MSATDLIRGLLDEAEEALSTETIHAQIGGEPGDENKTGALLNYLAKRGEARNTGEGRAGAWVKMRRRGKGKASAPPQAVSAALHPPALAAKAIAPTPGITPAGSVAVADDGSVLLIEDDRVVSRLTAQQATNIAVLVTRFSPAR